MRFLSLTLLVALCAGSAAAAVTSASVKRLSVGTTLDVVGTDFAKPVQAWVQVGSKKVPLKIDRGATDTAFTATLKTLPQGVNGAGLLRVKAKGSNVPFSLAGMTIELPQPSGISPESAAPGQNVTISGTYFGTKKGKVVVGTKKAKIRTWTDTSITFQVPSSVNDDLVFVYVSNAAGRATSDPVLAIDG